jgi:hypothetical protein
LFALCRRASGLSLPTPAPPPCCYMSLVRFPPVGDLLAPLCRKEGVGPFRLCRNEGDGLAKPGELELQRSAGERSVGGLCGASVLRTAVGGPCSPVQLTWLQLCTAAVACAAAQTLVPRALFVTRGACKHCVEANSFCVSLALLRCLRLGALRSPACTCPSSSLIIFALPFPCLHPY